MTSTGAEDPGKGDVCTLGNRATTMPNVMNVVRKTKSLLLKPKSSSTWAHNKTRIPISPVVRCADLDASHWKVVASKVHTRDLPVKLPTVSTDNNESFV